MPSTTLSAMGGPKVLRPDAKLWGRVRCPATPAGSQVRPKRVSRGSRSVVRLGDGELARFFFARVAELCAYLFLLGRRIPLHLLLMPLRRGAAALLASGVAQERDSTEWSRPNAYDVRSNFEL